jgi:hypothetical protein
MKGTRGVATVAILAVAIVLLAGGLGVNTNSQAPAEPKKPTPPPSVTVPIGSCPASFVELLKISQEQKKGLTFYIKGQTVGGLVVKASGDGTVEVRNPEFGRILIKLEDVSAIAMN